MQGDSECRAVKFYSPRDSGLNLLLFSERTDQVQVVDITSGFKRKQILAGTAPPSLFSCPLSSAIYFSFGFATSYHK